MYGGRNVGNAVTKKTYEAAKEPLAEDNPDWNTVITDKIDAAKDANDNSAALFWLGGGAIAIIAAGGGVWYMNRRRTKKQQETMVKDAQTINPDDTTSLNELPYSVLEDARRRNSQVQMRRFGQPMTNSGWPLRNSEKTGHGPSSEPWITRSGPWRGRSSSAAKLIRGQCVLTKSARPCLWIS